MTPGVAAAALDSSTLTRHGLRKKCEAGQWWQMEAGSVKRTSAVVTQGRKRVKHNQYVKSYKARVSRDGHSWTEVDNGKVFKANTAANDEKVENKFAASVTARFPLLASLTIV